MPTQNTLVVFMPRDNLKNISSPDRLDPLSNPTHKILATEVGE